MSLRDKRDAPVSTGNRRSLERLESVFGDFQGFFGDPMAGVDEILREDPDFVLAHCFRAGLCVVSSEKGAEPILKESVEAAEALADKANDRERGHIAAARAWLDGDYARAVDRYGRVLIDYPRDAMALQFAHLTDFLLGYSWMLRDRVARVLPHWSEGVPGYGYLLGMHAFGLEEMNQYGRAEETGRRAVELIPTDTWGIHAVAHVLEMQGRLDEGVDWYRARIDDWTPDNGFAFHNWWHLSLYHLDLGQTERVLEIYDSAIRPGPSEVAMEMVDAAALLWRLHLRGVEVGDRWKELADSYVPMVEDAYYAFNDAHAMMSFVADGREASAKRLLGVLERRAEEGGANGMMTRDVGLPFCRAIEAFAEGDYAAAVEVLSALRPIANRFGGSNAQRDLLSLTLIEAALRDGQGRLAHALLAERTDLKPGSPFAWAATARALEMTGNADGAERALTKSAALAAAATAAVAA